MSDDASRADAPRLPGEATGYAGPGWTTRSASVMRTLLLSALVSVVVGGLSFQLGLGDTSFDRPGEVVLLFVDIAPALWFGAAPLVLHALRWRAIGQRFRWVLVAAVVAATLSMVVRLVVAGDSLLPTLLDPFTAAFVLWIGAAVVWTRARVRRLAAGTDRGIAIIGLGLGFAGAAAGLALGTLRLTLVGPEVPPGAVPAASASSPATALFVAATFAMIAGLFWLADRTRNR